MSDLASSEPVIAPLPTPVSVEPRVVPPAEAGEIARQTEEAKVAANAAKSDKKAAEPVADKAKPISTRDALRNAAAKVNAEPASPIKAAEPQPAEPAAKDAPAAKVDAKAAEPVKDAPARGGDGKFTAKVAEPASKADAQAPKADASATKTDAVVKPAALPSHTAEPPPARFSPAAKEKWAEAPDEVRSEVTRAVTELTKGFEKHRAAAERDATLAEFHEMAGKGQKQLRDVVAQYVGMENLLRSDPVKALELIAKNAGLDLRAAAAKWLGQAPDAVASAADATILELRAELAEIKKGLGTIQTERAKQQTDTTTEAVTKFAADHPRFDELSDEIAFFLRTRTKDLAEAYSLAERLNPAPAPKVEAEPKPVASSAPVVSIVPVAAHTDDRGQKSIAGAPSAGSDLARKQPSSSIKEAIRRAAAAAR